MKKVSTRPPRSKPTLWNLNFNQTILNRTIQKVGLPFKETESTKLKIDLTKNSPKSKSLGKATSFMKKILNLKEIHNSKWTNLHKSRFQKTTMLKYRSIPLSRMKKTYKRLTLSGTLRNKFKILSARLTPKARPLGLILNMFQKPLLRRFCWKTDPKN